MLLEDSYAQARLSCMCCVVVGGNRVQVCFSSRRLSLTNIETLPGVTLVESCPKYATRKQRHLKNFAEYYLVS
jgi:hypothetical protein